MKYAVIFCSSVGATYLRGFTNTERPYNTKANGGIIYTVELTELSSLMIRLEGDALIHLS